MLKIDAVINLEIVVSENGICLLKYKQNLMLNSSPRYPYATAKWVCDSVNVLFSVK